MNLDKSFQRWTGIFAILAGILALLSLIVGLAGVNYDFEVFSDTSSLIAAGTAAAGFIRWSYWLNMLGNYLLAHSLARPPSLPMAQANRVPPMPSYLQPEACYTLC